MKPFLPFLASSFVFLRNYIVPSQINDEQTCDTSPPHPTPPHPQVLTILQEAFPAVTAAETAVKLRPLWWEGWQTLGRAQLNLGEVDLVSTAAMVTKERKRERNWGLAYLDSNVAPLINWFFRASPVMVPSVSVFQTFLQFQLSCFGKPASRFAAIRINLLVQIAAPAAVKKTKQKTKRARRLEMYRNVSGPVAL